MQIRRTHDLGAAEVRRRIDLLADELKQKFGVDTRWTGDRLEISGSGIDGRLDVADDSVDLKLTLGFALKLMEPGIRSAVERAMDRHLV